ncbi:MAG: M4 family metallopeptidase [Micromonosporaceae bacterium]
MAAVAAPASAGTGSAALRVDQAAAAAAGARAHVASNPQVLQGSAGEAYAQGGVITAGALSYVPYQRTYRGLPVVGGDFVVVTNAAGKVLFTSVGQENRIGTIGLTPSLSRAAAEAIAGQLLSSVSGVEGTNLVVFALDGPARLAWQTTVVGTSAQGASRRTVTVDALNGRVLDQLERVMSGTGNGNWEGNVTIATTSSGGTFFMSSPVTSNMPCQDAANNTTFSGPDDVWGNGVGTNKETGCVDALYGAETEATMLSTWLGRNGMNGSGGAWPIRVGLNDLNAFYNGTQVQIGHNQAGAWIGSTDVIAHEMGHGIDDTTPGGISRNGTQEFVADVFGAATETFANNPADPPDFLVGEEINLVGSGPIRNMYDPSLLGDPNCYTKRINRVEVHAAAGPGNHWFYLAAIGSNAAGQPVSPTCNNTTVTGIGVQAALQIFYNAMLMKTSQSSYPKYRLWTLQAAKNLFPGDCTNFNAIKAAWNAVSVPAQAGEATCP